MVWGEAAAMGLWGPRHLPRDTHPPLTHLQGGAGCRQELPVVPLLLPGLQPQHLGQEGALGGVPGVEPGGWTVGSGGEGLAWALLAPVQSCSQGSCVLGAGVSLAQGTGAGHVAITSVIPPYLKSRGSSAAAACSTSRREAAAGTGTGRS